MKSNTGAAFMMWRGKIEPRLSASERTELAGALQELKLVAMREAGNAPVNDLDARLRARINGRPVRELFIEACNARLLRLAPERAALQQALAHNRQIGGSDARSADFIAVQVERQTDRLVTINAEVAATETRLHELDFDPAP